MLQADAIRNDRKQLQPRLLGWRDQDVFPSRSDDLLDPCLLWPSIGPQTHSSRPHQRNSQRIKTTHKPTRTNRWRDQIHGLRTQAHVMGETLKSKGREPSHQHWHLSQTRQRCHDPLPVHRKLRTRIDTCREGLQLVAFEEIVQCMTAKTLLLQPLTRGHLLQREDLGELWLGLEWRHFGLIYSH